VFNLKKFYHRGTEAQRYRGFFYKDYRKDAKYAKSAKKRERIIGLCAFSVKNILIFSLYLCGDDI